MFPSDVRKEGEELVIEWDDGHRGLYRIKELRQACPCATCRAAKTKPNDSPLRILQPGEAVPDDLTLLEAEVVGRYALQFRWSDGHHEGIYSFDYLRKLCRCERCRAEEKKNNKGQS